jgi:hypothetical protein
MFNKFISQSTKDFCNFFYYYYPNTQLDVALATPPPPPPTTPAPLCLRHAWISVPHGPSAWGHAPP